MKNKKIIIIILIILLAIISTITIIFFPNKQNEEQAKKLLTDFVNLIQEKNYEAMYEKVSITDMSKEEFIARNKNIYEGIECNNIKIEITDVEKQENGYKILYNETMFTAGGEIQFDNEVTTQKSDKGYKLKWSSKFIFPQLSDNQKVRISTIKAKRGEILDRNNQKLASNGTILSCRNSSSESQEKIKSKI